MGVMHELSPTPTWLDSMHAFLKPYWDDVLNSSWAEGFVAGTHSLREMQGWILQLYPFIHSFPKFLAEALIKVEDDYSRNYYIGNIRVEKHHATQWVWMGKGFGLSEKEMMALVDGTRPVLRDVQSLTDWLWYINAKGSVAEAVAATSFAIEGVTGDIARKMLPHFEKYRDMPGVDVNPKTLAWTKAHAHYDDEHPKIALEIVRRYATTEQMQTKCMFAARRSLQLLNQALVTSYQAYSPQTRRVSRVSANSERRADDRRNDQVTIAFPDRRFAERRGAVARLVA